MINHERNVMNKLKKTRHVLIFSSRIQRLYSKRNTEETANITEFAYALLDLISIFLKHHP